MRSAGSANCVVSPDTTTPSPSASCSGKTYRKPTPSSNTRKTTSSSTPEVSCTACTVSSLAWFCTRASLPQAGVQVSSTTSRWVEVTARPSVRSTAGSRSVSPRPDGATTVVVPSRTTWYIRVPSTTSTAASIERSGEDTVQPASAPASCAVSCAAAGAAVATTAGSRIARAAATAAGAWRRLRGSRGLPLFRLPEGRCTFSPGRRCRQRRIASMQTSGRSEFSQRRCALSRRGGAFTPSRQ